jgi:hypothetical protein
VRAKGTSLRTRGRLRICAAITDARWFPLEELKLELSEETRSALFCSSRADLDEERDEAFAEVISTLGISKDEITVVISLAMIGIILESVFFWTAASTAQSFVLLAFTTHSFQCLLWPLRMLQSAKIVLTFLVRKDCTRCVSTRA